MREETPSQMPSRMHQFSVVCSVCFCIQVSAGDERATGTAQTPPNAKPAGAQIKEPVKVDKPKGAAAVADIEILAGPVVEPLREKIVIKVVAPRPAAAANNAAAQQQQMEQRYLQQYRQILISELAFIRQVCEVPKDKRPGVKAAGEAGLNEFAHTMATRQQQPRVVGISTEDNSHQPRSVIRAALAAALEKAISADAMSHFREDMADRLAYRKHVATAVMVSRIDRILYLSAEQREAIRDAIESNWDEKWESWLGLLNYRGDYLPMIPDAAVTRHLTADQKSVWSTIGKVDFGYVEGGLPFGVAQEGWWGDDEDQDTSPKALILKNGT